MTVLPFRPTNRGAAPDRRVGGLLEGFSIEVTPRTAAKIVEFRALLPEMAAQRESLIGKIHLFPLGGIGTACDYVARQTGSGAASNALTRGTAR